MIVSSRTVVLPVKRSPMISSRWPRPIGIIVSMALIPVCTGLSTRCRVMTHIDLAGPVAVGDDAARAGRHGGGMEALGALFASLEIFFGADPHFFLRGRVRQAAAQLLQRGGGGGVNQMIPVLEHEPADD